MNTPDMLTRRERDILHLLSQGLSDQEIAGQLVLTVGTVKWYNKQIYGKLGVKNRAEARQLARRSALLGEQYPAHRPTHNLPAPLTPFVGRKRELDDLRPLLAANRLLTITGPGGVGKSRLALQLAESQVDNFADGVYFIPLAPLESPEDILWTIAEQLRFRFTASGSSEDQLLDYLREKHLLLLMDNFEHLLPDVGLVSAILGAARGIKVIATSRLRLNLYGEAIYPLSGLTMPDPDIGDHAMQHDAIQLFVACAGRALPGFTPDSDQLRHIARICWLVEGTPLGIELAAPWVETLTLAEIGGEIEKNLDFLNRQLPDVPPRQHSIRAAFDYSWSLLTGDERAAFSSLSVFRGGFTRDAAEAVCGVRLPGLASLVSKSLLRYESGRERYHIHELLNQYAEEKLTVTGRLDTLRDTHLAYYAAALDRLNPGLKGAGQLAALETVEMEFENIRIAWNRAIQTRNSAHLEHMLEPLYLFCFIRNRYQEGDALFQAARRAFAPQDGEPPTPLWGHILAHHLLHTPTLRDPVETALSITRQGGTRQQLAFGLWTLARVETAAANPDRALALCEECLSHYQALDDPFWRARLLLQISVLYGNMNRAAECQTYLQAALDVSHAIGAINTQAHALGNLAGIILSRDNLPEAERLYEEATRVHERLNDHRNATWSGSQLGVTAFLKGDFEQLHAVALTTSDVSVTLREAQLVGMVQLLRGLHAAAVGDYAAGRRDTEATLAHYNIFIALYGRLAFAMACCGLGDFEAAGRANREFIRLQWEWGDTASCASALALEAMPLAHTGEPEQAVELLALAFTYPQTVGGWLEAWPPLTDLRGRLQALLGKPAYEAAWERGKALDLGAVIAGIVDPIMHRL